MSTPITKPIIIKDDPNSYKGKKVTIAVMNSNLNFLLSIVPNGVFVFDCIYDDGKNIKISISPDTFCEKINFKLI